eukprot:scaffold169720_cov13-Prasinocladus_malaysianus.AAC.1
MGIPYPSPLLCDRLTGLLPKATTCPSSGTASYHRLHPQRAYVSGKQGEECHPVLMAVDRPVVAWLMG